MDKYRQEFLPFWKNVYCRKMNLRQSTGLIMLLDHYIKVDADGNKKPRMKKLCLKI